MSVLSKFKDSSKELTKVSTIAICAMMLALRVVLGIFANFSLTVIPLQVVKVSLVFIPMMITGYMYGPVCAGIVAGAGDLLSYLIAPTSFGFLPAITACYILEGIIYGLCLYKTELELKYIIFAKAFDLIFCTLTLHSFMLQIHFYPDTPLYMIMLYRAAVLIPFAAIEVFFIWLMKPLLLRLKNSTNK